MRITTLIIASLLGFIIQSCSNGLNIPITEELDIKVLRTYMEDNSEFKVFYNFALERRSIVMSSRINQAKWGEITYQELKEAYDCNIPFGNDKWSKKWKEWDEDYSELVKKYSCQTDSIFEYWKHYKKENGLDKYAKIEFVGIENEEVWNLHYGKATPKTKSRAKFKITPLKGELRTLKFKAFFHKKEVNGDIPFLLRGIYDEIFPFLERKTYDGDIVTYFVNDERVISEDLDGLDYDFNKKEIDEDKLKDEFVFRTFIYYVEDQYYQENNFEDAIPEELRDYIAFDDEYAKEKCIDKVIIKNINSDFPDRNQYQEMRAKEAINKINPKLLDLIYYKE